MTQIGLGIVIVILIVAIGLALTIGYFLGSRFGGNRSIAMQKANAEHENFQSEVREHFEQTSAIMSRLASDYRDMYEHFSQGAERLGGVHAEKLVTPPPAPESLVQQHDQQPESAETDTTSSPSTEAASETPENHSSDTGAQADSQEEAPEADSDTPPGSRNDDQTTQADQPGKDETEQNKDTSTDQQTADPTGDSARSASGDRG